MEPRSRQAPRPPPYNDLAKLAWKRQRKKGTTPRGDNFSCFLLILYSWHVAYVAWGCFLSKAWAETQATKTQKKCPVSPCRLVGGCWREIGWFGSDVPCFGSEEDQESKLGSTCMQVWVSDLRTWFSLCPAKCAVGCHGYPEPSPYRVCCPTPFHKTATCHPASLNKWICSGRSANWMPTTRR